MKLLPFSADQLAAGDVLSSAYSELAQTIAKRHMWEDRARGRVNSSSTAPAGSQGIEGFHDPAAQNRVLPDARHMADILMLRTISKLDGLEAIIDRFAGKKAYFFPIEPQGSIYVSEGDEIVPMRHTSGIIQLDQHPSLPNLLIQTMPKFGEGAPQYVQMTGEEGIATLGRIAIIEK